MPIINQSISPSEVVRGDGAWIKSLDQITKLCKKPLILGRSSSTNKIRTSIGIGVDWFTIIGPLSFSLSEVITKEESDIEESFRFRLGTTF